MVHKGPRPRKKPDLNTAWTPLRQRGDHFFLHRLVHESSDRMVLKTTWIAGFQCLLLTLFGLVFLLSLNPAIWDQTTLYKLLSGLLTLAFAGLLWHNWSKPVVFDKRACKLRRKYRRIGVSGGDNTSPELRLDELHALQIVPSGPWDQPEQGRDDDNRYQCNLIFKDGARMAFLESDDLPKIRHEAGRLADFLEIPTWDATHKSGERF